MSFCVLGCSGTGGNSNKTAELQEEAVSKKILRNGLTVLVKPTPSTDLVSITVMVRSGTLSEGRDLGSGICHLVEHMVFKGTKSRKVGEIESQIKSLGGFINGSTSHDITSYYVTVPKEHFREAMAILKDMLLNAAFDPLELEKEREVIIKEIKLNEDEPQGSVIRKLYETAYISHPYKYPLAGYAENLKLLKRDNIIRYYEKLYTPNRIVVSIAGRIDPALAISGVEDEFKDFRPQDLEQMPVEREPEQISERSVDIEKEMNLAYLASGYHSTGLNDRDLFAMDVLSMILGRGEGSRLNKSLVYNKRSAYATAAFNYTPKDPGLFIITAIVDKGNIDMSERDIDIEIEKLRTRPVSNSELAAAKRKVISDYIFSRQTIEDQSRDLALNEALTGSHDFSRRYLAGVGSVTNADIRRVANRYLAKTNMTRARIVPMGFKKEGVQKTGEYPQGDSIQKLVLPNGVRLLIRRDAKTPTVSLTVAFLGGIGVETKDNNGISNLTATMLLKGTKTRNEDKIEGFIESLGGRISPFSGFNGFGADASFLKDDLDKVLDIVKDVITNSVMPEQELERERSIIIANIRDEDDDIFQRGVNAARKLLFGDRQYGLRYLGDVTSLMKITRDSLTRFYREYCVSTNMVLSISGDIDIEKTKTRLTKLFSDMPKKDPPPAPPKGVSPCGLASENILMPKEESLLLMGFLTCDARNPDRYAIELLCSVLSGQSGRLFSKLRDKESMAYTLGLSPKIGMDTGYLLFYVATTKERLEEARGSLRDEIASIKQGLVSDDELEHAKRDVVTNYQMNMQMNSFVAFQSAVDELFGAGHDNILRYKEKIEGVSKEDIKAVANKYFNLESFAEVVITPK